jgi:hypothetical protein
MFEGNADCVLQYMVLYHRREQCVAAPAFSRHNGDINGTQESTGGLVVNILS